MDTFKLHKENEKATILASASITVAESRGIGGYVEASNTTKALTSGFLDEHAGSPPTERKACVTNHLRPETVGDVREVGKDNQVRISLRWRRP